MNMINKALSRLAVGAIVAGLSSSAFASYLGTLQLDQDTTNYSVGNGGAFIVTSETGPINLSSYSSLATDTVSSSPGYGGFLTFCIEYNEEFYPSNWNTPGKTVYNYNLSNGAKNGGVSGQTTTNYDGISNATAWLYSEFAQGFLSNDYPSDFAYNQAGFGNLQQAIWYLEGEVNSVSGLAASLVADAQGKNYGVLGAWNVDNNGAFGVQAINLYYQDGGNSQDQLYFSKVPDQGATIALLGISLLCVAGFRRKFASAK